LSINTHKDGGAIHDAPPSLINTLLLFKFACEL